MAAWYYAQDGQQRGPVELAELQGMLESGRLARQDLVWTEGMPQWVASTQVPALAPAMPPLPSAAPTIPPTQAQAPAGAAPMVPAYQTPYSPYAPQSPHMGLAVTSLVLSLLSFMGFWILTSIPGAICGHIALKGMRRTGDFRGQGLAVAGFWVGLIVSLFALLLIVGFIVIIVVAAVAGSHG